MLPQGANQFWDAQRCASLGVGITLVTGAPIPGRAPCPAAGAPGSCWLSEFRLLPGEVSPGAVRRAVQALLEEAGYREQAGRLAAEIAAMPSPEKGAALLEALAGSGSALT